MLAVLAFVAFVISAVLYLIGGHSTVVIWAIIAGGLLVSAAVAWGFAGPYWNRNRGPVA